jgi:hypothetical protein
MEQTNFSKLFTINVNDKTEKRGAHTYLSWAWAWAEAKKVFPSMNRHVYEDINGHNFFNDGRTCWVKVGVTIDGLEHIDYLPVMDFKNASVPFEKITSFDVNKAIQRSTTKALALHGLGLYIYSKEDLPDGEEPAVVEPAKKPDFPAHGTPDNTKAMKYVNENVKKGSDFIINMLEKKYTISENVKIKINELCTKK